MSPKNPDDNRVIVRILGEDYTVKSDADTAYVAEVASIVDERMRELYNSPARPRSKTKLAILAAINIADELLQHRQLVEPGNKELEIRTRQLIELLDEGLIGDTLQ